MTTTETQIERDVIAKLADLKYSDRPDIRDRAALEQIVTPEVFAYDGTPLFYTLVNIKEWCKNSFKVVNQLRINTDNRHHFSFNANERFLPLYQFADVDDKKITHLDSLSKKFLAKCTLGEMISRYMVLVAELKEAS